MECYSFFDSFCQHLCKIIWHTTDLLGGRTNYSICSQCSDWGVGKIRLLTYRLSPFVPIVVPHVRVMGVHSHNIQIDRTNTSKCIGILSICLLERKKKTGNHRLNRLISEIVYILCLKGWLSKMRLSNFWNFFPPSPFFSFFFSFSYS